ncbi:MAG: 1-acyl-sn-glycerol-3-phosphate acyltransferase [Candidatus Competibacteraceae bacterium]|nr:MAG: 1-acyl-sn-glycerol-3-phosphate acyltransferase [Candidatus Competibacteraceae bacterium]
MSDDRAWSRTGRRLRRVPLVALHVLAGIVVAALLRPGRNGMVSDRPLVLWSRVLCWIMGMRATVTGTPAGGAVLFVANHVSWLDIFCIAGVCPTHFLAKREVGDWPLFGWLSRRAGTAFIRRGGDNGAGEAAEQLSWRLRNGGRVLVFPEGTSTMGETVRRFFPRLFQAAILARCPVQAIALRYPHRDGVHPTVPFVGDASLLPHLWWLLGERRIEVALRFCEPLSALGRTRNELADHTRAQISGALSGTDTAQPLLSVLANQG